MLQDISYIRKNWFIDQVEKLNNDGITNVEIAKRMSILPQYITNITKGGRGASEKFVIKFCDTFGLNHNDLLNKYKIYENHPVIKDAVLSPTPFIENKVEGIPLIPIEAVAGFAMKGEASVMEYDITERYMVPEFSVRGVKYLIRVSGSSMYPKYSNGDVLACRPITDLSFFQWGKVYVLDTDQGALVKRLFEGKDDTCIECRSDNKEHYPAFQIPKLSIRSVSIVVGVIRLD